MATLSQPDGDVADLAVVNGRLVTPAGILAGGLGVVGGRIDRFLAPETPVRAARVVDARGCYILPGVVDSHVHFREPGLGHKEDWEHGSRAAAAGGVTTVIDMPNTRPAFLDPRTVADRVALVEGRSLVDFCFHLGVDGAQLHLLERVQPGAVAAAKVFMAGHRTAPHVIREPGLLAAIFERAAERDLLVVLHAEDQATFDLLDAWREARGECVDDDAARPRTGGIVAVARVIELVRRFGTAAHVLHVSSAEEADLLAAAARELPVTFEVTGHHLTFTRADAVELGTRVKLSPAIRTERDRERLWRAVLQDEVATIGSDHSPHTRKEKLEAREVAPPGMPGVQELLAAVHTGLVLTHGHPDWRMQRIAELLAARPADLFGLGARKGRLALGMDADLVVFDARTEWRLSADAIRSRCGWSPYEGRPLTGRALLTIRRGEVIWDAASGEFGPPAGRWLTVGERRRPAPGGPGGLAGRALEEVTTCR